MATADLNLIKAKDQRAMFICKHVDLEETSKTLLTADQTVSAFIQTLQQNAALKDIIGVIAQALPVREAVYWACLCVRDSFVDNPPADDLLAIKAAEQWVYQPDEDNRRLNEKLAEKLEHATAAAWVANAVYWSGGSITPKDEAKVEPPDGVFGKAISGAVNLASAHEEIKKMQALQNRFIERGISIAQGGKGEIVSAKP